MKTLLLSFFAVLFSLSVSAQDYYMTGSNQSEKSVMLSDSIQQNHVYKAGRYLKASSTLQGAAIGGGVASGIIFVIGTDKEDSKRKTFNGIGTVLAVTAVISEICSIVYKYKSGSQLEIAAGRITYKF